MDDPEAFLEDLARDLRDPPAVADAMTVAKLWRQDIFRVACERPRHLQDFPEFPMRLRGAFGKALHALPARKTIRGKPVPHAFDGLFRPLAAGTSGDEVPRPLAFRAWVEGELVFAELRLFGWGQVWRQEAGEAFVNALLNGINLADTGRTRVSLVPADITYCSTDGLDLTPEGNVATLTFRSPYAVRHRHALASTPDRIGFSIVRRVAAMARWQGFSISDARPALQAFNQLRSDHHEWRAYRWQRHSRRQGDTAIPVAGMLGTVTLSGDLRPALPWFAMAQCCGIGSHASLGMGWFDLSVW